MDRAALEAEKRQELVSVASAMFEGEMNLIEGVRRICRLRFAIGNPDDEVFLPIRGIESETDSFPLGEVRSNWSAEYLRQLDAEMQNYLESARSDILQACEEIIRKFS